MKNKLVAIPLGLKKRVMHYLIYIKRIADSDLFSPELLSSVPISVIERIPFIKAQEIECLVNYLDSRGLSFNGGIPSRETCEAYTIKQAIALLTKHGYSVIRVLPK